MKKKKHKKVQTWPKNQEVKQDILLNSKMDKEFPYPEKLNIVKDHLRSDIFCLNNIGQAYMTVIKNPDENSVTYLREDLFPKCKDYPEAEIINDLKEEILIWKDQVESCQAGRKAIKIVILDRLSKFYIKIVFIIVFLWTMPAIFNAAMGKFPENNFVFLISSICVALASIALGYLYINEKKHYEDII